MRKRKGPKACGDLFKRGYWVNMIADMTGMSEAEVETKLMQRIRQLEKDLEPKESK